MIEEAEYCKKVVREHFNKPLIMTSEDEESFQEETFCHIYERVFTPKEAKVRDHCHVTGKYRGAGHISCNFKFRLTDKIPVIFHNVRVYDFHFLIRELG